MTDEQVAEALKRPPSERTPEENAACAADLAQRMHDSFGTGSWEVDMCNAAMLIIQGVCGSSESPSLGEFISAPVSHLAQHLLKESVTRQVATARLRMLPPGALGEPSGEREDAPAPDAKTKPRLH